MIQQFTPEHIPGQNYNSKIIQSSTVFIAALFTIAKTRKQFFLFWAVPLYSWCPHKWPGPRGIHEFTSHCYSSYPRPRSACCCLSSFTALLKLSHWDMWLPTQFGVEKTRLHLKPRWKGEGVLTGLSHSAWELHGQRSSSAFSRVLSPFLC